jgi:hypothetical protein
MNGLHAGPLAEPAKTRLDHNPSRWHEDTGKGDAFKRGETPSAVGPWQHSVAPGKSCLGFI